MTGYFSEDKTVYEARMSRADLKRYEKVEEILVMRLSGEVVASYRRVKD